MRRLLEHADRILVGGHRGCVCDKPENSIAAMGEGMKRGADYLEIDIQLTKDGIPIVYHDVRLEKRTALHGYVHEYESAQIKEQVPGLCTLREALEWGCQQDAYFALELKTVPIHMQKINMLLVEQMIPLVKRCGMAGQVLAFGQDYHVLRHVKNISPEFETGLIVPFVPENPIQLMQSMDALLYLSYVYNMTPDMIADLKCHGFYVSGAILREDIWVQKAIEVGVNMFESDKPEVAKQMIEMAL